MQLKIGFMLFFAMLLVSSLAQTPTEETITGEAHIKGGFGGPFFVYSNVGERDGGGAGGGGAFIIDNIFIGGFGQGETFGRVTLEDQKYYLSLGYGGFWLGYVNQSHKLVHFIGTLKVGWGGAVLSHDGEDGDDHDIEYEDEAFILHPEAGLELNVAHWFRIAAQGGYRFMNGVNELPGFSSNDFDSPSFALVMRFGNFGITP